MSSTGRINNLIDPSTAQDAATKDYVDTALGSSGTQTNNPTVTDAANANTNYRVLFTTTSSGRATLNNDGDLYYNPNTNTLTAGTFSGAFSGNASSASTASTASTATNGVDNGIFKVGWYGNYQNTTGLRNMDTVAFQVYPRSNAMIARPWRGAQSGVHFGGSSNAINGWSVDNDTGTNDDLSSFPAGLSLANFFSTFSNASSYGQSNYPRLSGANNCVAFFYGFIQCDFVCAGSDKRIKKNIKHIQDDDALLKLRKLKASRFEYVDKVKNKPYNVYGFIAQDLKDILPETIEIVKDYIPNFYFSVM